MIDVSPLSECDAIGTGCTGGLFAEQKVGGDGGSGHGKGGEDAPADVPAHGHWVPFASQMGGGRSRTIIRRTGEHFWDNGPKI